ncbi:MAG: hypothetical protein ACRDJP_05870, partial [Actinomycetota bacterium]
LLAVAVHGYVGHRLFLTPLTDERLFPARGFGDAAAARRVFVVTWHAVTAAFACSAVMMLLMASGAVTSAAAARFLAAMHVSFMLVALAVTGRRIGRMWRRPIPIAFAFVMTSVALMGWLGSR